jgi:two-component system chemotaxis sensor kinase CheA
VEGATANIVVLQADSLKFGLVVDEVNDTQEIVVKPLGRHVRAIPIFAGATVMGNGRVVLILDVPGLAVQAGVLSETRERRSVGSDVLPEEAQAPLDALLLVTGPDAARMAIPLSQITRLEEFSRSAVERLGDRDVVQYFGDILPLADLGGLMLESRTLNRSLPTTGAETIQALVYAKHGRQVGVVVDHILDTIEESLVNLRPATRQGVAGSLIIDGHVTEVLDLDALCAGLLAANVAERALVGARA